MNWDDAGPTHLTRPMNNVGCGCHAAFGLKGIGTTHHNGKQGTFLVATPLLGRRNTEALQQFN